MAAATIMASSGLAQESLKEKFKDHFEVGTAFNNYLFSEKGNPTLKLIAEQYGTISPENAMKWQPFQPEANMYNYEPADNFVEFGAKNKMYVVGHVLFWHNQTPDWVFTDAKGKQLNRKQLLKRMRERVRHVVKRYGCKIKAWDVVNEAILDSGKLRKSKWSEIIGDDWIEQAFRIADEELPKDVELFYNDYSMPIKAKHGAAIKLVKNLKKKGIRIDGIGMQGHWSLDWPSLKDIEGTVTAIAATGVQVHITELDISVLPKHPQMWNGNADVKLKLQQDPKLDPYKKGLPDAMQKRLAKRYTDLFGLFVKHSDKIKRVTFWGPTDRYSWLNNWPIKGRTNHALLFDRQGKPKPAYHAVMKIHTPAKKDKNE